MTEEPKTIKIRLKLTKKEIHRMTRIKRWEDESASTCIELGSRTMKGN